MSHIAHNETSGGLTSYPLVLKPNDVPEKSEKNEDVSDQEEILEETIRNLEIINIEVPGKLKVFNNHTLASADGPRPVSKPNTWSRDKSQSSPHSLNPPNWNYGTNNLPSQEYTSRASSGLCLFERGPVAVAQPEVIQNFLYPITNSLQKKIISYRKSVLKILSTDITANYNHILKKQTRSPLLVITGPGYISDPNQAKACAQWVGTMIGKKFNNLPKKFLPKQIENIYNASPATTPEKLLLSMRANLNKYNHAYDDPALSSGNVSVMTFEIQNGVPICRALLCELAEICPVVGEISDTITPQYLADLLCLGIVSSCLIESQLHRELVSGISFPVGFHCCDNLSSHVTSYEELQFKVSSALDAMYASSESHHFLSISKIGTVAVVGTIGNLDTFIIFQFNQGSLMLSLEEIESTITVIYEYPKLKLSTPRVVLDLGLISEKQYNSKLRIMNSLLTNDKISNMILGVIIDSGDHYIPTGFNFELHSEDCLNVLTNNSSDSVSLNEGATSGGHSYSIDDLLKTTTKLYQINRHFVKNRLFNKMSKIDNYSDENNANDVEFYEYFITANRMIHDLEDLI